jgi:hypothetical protein
MIKKLKFINEITKEEFNNELKCFKAETKSKDIKKLFSFWKKAKDDKNCDFGNGEYCYQRTKKEYNQFIDVLFLALKKHEKWICKQYDEKGGLKREYINGLSFVGRYLNDNDSELYDYWCILGKICPKCYREYGQSYFAINCKHNNVAKILGEK